MRKPIKKDLRNQLVEARKSKRELRNELMFAWTLINAAAQDFDDAEKYGPNVHRHHADRIQATLIAHGVRTDNFV